MAMVMDQQQQQQAYKHYCRVCKKGFSCGRALGGHMRAHGINDEPVGGPDDDNTSGCSEWGEDKPSQPPNNKRMYALLANPARFNSYRSCENCGREFVSWKSFLEHGKCSSEEEEEDEEEDAYYYDSLGSDADEDGLISRAGWSKGKRSRRANSSAVPVSVCPSTSEEEDLANCLVMLSSARVDPVIVVEPEESSASASKEEDRRYHPAAAAEKSKGPAAVAAAPAVPKGIFQCKACKKVFSSHQALGGHRASHKKVKGCFAAKLHDMDVEAPPEEDMINQDNTNQEAAAAAAAAAAMAMAIVPFDNTPIAVVPLKKKSKVHECSICHRQFASGQALGGHKRCHWITSNSPDPTSAAKPQPVLQQDPPSNNHHHQHQHHELTLRPMFDPAEVIDLNMPAASMDGLSALRNHDIGSPLRLDLPAAMYQQPWVDQDHKNKTTTSSNNMNNNYNNEGGCSMNMDDEVHSKVKLAKLSELKDINAGGEVSPWLQVGIGSSGNEGSQENEKGEY